MENMGDEINKRGKDAMNHTRSDLTATFFC